LYLDRTESSILEHKKLVFSSVGKLGEHRWVRVAMGNHNRSPKIIQASRLRQIFGRTVLAAALLVSNRGYQNLRPSS
jgi:hypothetical protein